VSGGSATWLAERVGGPPTAICRRQRIAPVRMCVNVIHEDDDYFFCHKPAGLTVAGDDRTESYHELAKRHARTHFGCETLNLLHRLDKGTSGIMVYAKSIGAARHYLALQQERGAITKDYVAIVPGVPPKPAGRIAGGICLARDRTSYVIRGKKSGKSVLTTYKLLASERHARLGELSGLSLRLFSGRKHQIRASCRHLALPIVGDKRYGGAPYHTMLLHAFRSSFVGRSGAVYNVSCAPGWALDHPEQQQPPEEERVSLSSQTSASQEAAFFARLLLLSA